MLIVILELDKCLKPVSIFLHKMGEEFKRKVKIRGGHRASAKRIMTLTEESLTTFDPKNPDKLKGETATSYSERKDENSERT